MGSRKRITVALVGLVVLVLVGWLVKSTAGSGAGSSTKGTSRVAVAGTVPGADSGLPVTALTQLPPQAADTWRLIVKGGPYPHRQDGVVFQNREGLLPHKGPGYYQEFTVDTPGSPDRGARRLIEGAGKELYYTGDHYKSFVVVDPEH